MKAIYTKIGNDIYKVNQDTFVPSILCNKGSGVSSNVNTDSFNKMVTQNIFINTLNRSNVNSNAENVEEMLNHLRENLVTEIKTIQNFFKVYIDYSVLENGKEIEHSGVVRPVKPVDKAVLLGVASNNECVYRRVKNFNPELEIRIKNNLPHGIMQTPKANYTVRIHNIALFQDFSYIQEIHNSIYEVPYRLGTSSMNACFDDMKMVYSTANEGIEISPITLTFVPRVMKFAIDITLDNYIVVYDDNVVEQLILENKDIINNTPIDEEEIITPPVEEDEETPDTPEETPSNTTGDDTEEPSEPEDNPDASEDIEP